MPTAKTPPRNLIMRLGHMGDVVLVSGLVSYFGRRWACKFDILTREQWAPLFLHHPHVEKIIPARNDNLRGKALFRYLKEIANSYSPEDVFYDLHGVLRSRLLAALWPGKVRRYQKLGLERRLFMVSGGKAGGGRLRASSVPQRYATAFCDEKNGQPPRLLPEQDLLPQLFLAQEEKHRASQRLATLFPGLKTCEHLVAIHPFATHQNKSWPAQMWQALAARLDSRGIPWIVVGAAPKGLAEIWSGDNSFVNMTTLRETMALLSQSALLVTGDSGPMHLARAVKTKVVALFGPTVKEWGFFPTAEEGIVLETRQDCRPCSLHGAKPCPHNGICLRDISPEMVTEAVLNLLAAPRHSPPLP